MWPTGDVNIEKRSGPRTEPWGTPVDREVFLDCESPTTNTLHPTRQIWADPANSTTWDTETGLKSRQEYVVVNGVKGSAQV